MEIGISHTSHLTVEESHLAVTLGSGDMHVLGTPAMLSLMENAAMLAVSDFLPDGSTTVGSKIESTHLRPTAKGRTVSATAVLTEIEGRKLTFSIVAHEEHEKLGEGTHIRYIVDRAKFLAKLAE